jgi:putative acetyltransferase
MRMLKMAEAFPKTALRPMLPADAPVLAAIFIDSIDVLTEEDYSEAQRAAWASAAEDIEEFATRLSKQLTLVATLAGSPVGFASLKGADELDMLYVHPHAARQGVATALVDAMEKLAAARGAKRLTVDASDTAKPLFETRGYRAESRNTVEREGEWLANTTMVKPFAAPSGTIQ